MPTFLVPGTGYKKGSTVLLAAVTGNLASGLALEGIENADYLPFWVRCSPWAEEGEGALQSWPHLPRMSS